MDPVFSVNHQKSKISCAVKYYNEESNLSAKVNNSCANILEDHPNSLKIYALNVCGIISKLKYPDLEEICENHDILCFLESKLDDLDEVEFKNFMKLPPLNRKGAKRKSGGIIVFVKEYLYENIEILESSCENVLWFIVKKRIT